MSEIFSWVTQDPDIASHMYSQLPFESKFSYSLINKHCNALTKKENDMKNYLFNVSNKRDIVVVAERWDSKLDDINGKVYYAGIHPLTYMIHEHDVEPHEDPEQPCLKLEVLHDPVHSCFFSPCCDIATPKTLHWNLFTLDISMDTYKDRWNLFTYDIKHINLREHLLNEYEREIYKNIAMCKYVNFRILKEPYANIPEDTWPKFKLTTDWESGFAPEDLGFA